MKLLIVGIIALVFAAPSFAGTVSTDYSALKAKADSETGADQIKPALEVVDQAIQAAKQSYDAGDNSRARTAVADATTYAKKAGDAAVTTGKHLKHTEIHLRKAASKLEALRRSVEFDERAPLAAAVHEFDTIRTALLDRMFMK